MDRHFLGCLSMVLCSSIALGGLWGAQSCGLVWVSGLQGVLSAIGGHDLGILLGDCGPRDLLGDRGRVGEHSAHLGVSSPTGW